MEGDPDRWPQPPGWYDEFYNQPRRDDYQLIQEVESHPTEPPNSTYTAVPSAQNFGAEITDSGVVYSEQYTYFQKQNYNAGLPVEDQLNSEPLNGAGIEPFAGRFAGAPEPAPLGSDYFRADYFLQQYSDISHHVRFPISDFTDAQSRDRISASFTPGTYMTENEGIRTYSTLDNSNSVPLEQTLAENGPVGAHSGSPAASNSSSGHIKQSNQQISGPSSLVRLIREAERGAEEEAAASTGRDRARTGGPAPYRRSLSETFLSVKRKQSKLAHIPFIQEFRIKKFNRPPQKIHQAPQQRSSSASSTSSGSAAPDGEWEFIQENPAAMPRRNSSASLGSK